jgi:hypothetical protein
MDGRMTDIAKEEGGASGVLARGGAGPNEPSGACVCLTNPRPALPTNGSSRP